MKKPKAKGAKKETKQKPNNPKAKGPNPNPNPNPKPTFCICSFGGSGSTMLTRFLMQYGKVVHIHDRKPPEFLTITKQIGDYDGTFSTTRVKDADLHNVVVMYLFRDPTEAQISRWSLQHFQHIQVPDFDKYKHILSDPQTYINNNQNLLQYNQFHQNYIEAKPKNYTIYAINYHKIFDPNNILLLCETLKLPSTAHTNFPTQKETSTQKWMQYRAGLYRLNTPEMFGLREAPFLRKITHEINEASL